jgi:HEAT repeats
MISGIVVLVIAAFQMALIIGMVWFLLLTDGRMREQNQAELDALEGLREPLRAFLVLGDAGEAIAVALAGLPPSVAARQMGRLGGSMLAQEQLRKLALRVRNDAWVEKTLAGGRSRRWWKRMEAARLLTMVYGANDRWLLAKLVMDRHPAVAAAATAGIAAHADRALVEMLVRNLPRRSPTLRLQQMRGLKSHAEIATPRQVAALAGTLSAKDLQVMVQFGEILATPAALSAIVRLASHPTAAVRASVARALRAAFVPGAVDAARNLLSDPDWRVRAAAARALEGLRVTAAVPALSEALRDEQWWVRFRAAVALAGLGEPGRTALVEAVGADDPYASEMAISVGGLSEANRLDLGG